MANENPPPTPVSRRRFLQLSAAVPAVLAAQSLLPSGFASAAAAAETPAPAAPKKYPIGLELYSVRGELSKDFPGTLRQVAKIGYEVVEVYAPYFAWTFPYAKDVRRQLD